MQALETGSDAAAEELFGAALRAHRAGRLAEAEAGYLQLLKARPHVGAHANLGLLYVARGRPEEAEAAYRRALQLDPQHPIARANLGVLLLDQGRYAEGWPLYESRFAAGLKAPPALPFPKWTGQALAGKSILVWPEQGFGDYIQFVRYAPLLRRLGASRLTLVCAPALAGLMASVDGVDEVRTAGDAVLPHDYWVCLMSLPALFGTTAETVPAQLPYIHPDAGRLSAWRRRTRGRGLRVGVVWKGSPINSRDSHRSLPGLDILDPVLKVPDVAFYSLQRGEAGGDARESAPGMEPLGHLIADFSDAAAAIASLDLLITVDTAYAHLAGAIGRRCWVLLDKGADWRWIAAGGGSLWYPQVARLFRQHDAGDWGPVAALVAHELRQLAPAGSGA